MRDPIDRQAAIDEITEYGSGDIIYMSVGELRGRIEHLPSAQPEPQWIPCSERLPEEKDAGIILKKLGKNKRSDYVIATVDVKGERMTVTACTYDGVWYWNMKYAFPEYEIVAWMPIPEPYRGGDER